MSWLRVAPSYVPSYGEHVRVRVSFVTAFDPTFSSIVIPDTHFISLAKSSGLDVIRVDRSLSMNEVMVTLSADGVSRMDEIGGRLCAALNSSWLIAGAQADSYERWVPDLIKGPSTQTTVSLVAVAAIVIVGFLILRSIGVVR